MFKKNKNISNDKIDTNSLNEVIKLSKIILKILFFVMIIAGIYSLIVLIKELGIVDFFVTLLKIVAPLFVGIVIAWLFNPLMKQLSKKGVRRGISATLIYVAMAILVFLIVQALIPILLEQINDFVGTIPATLKNVIDWINEFFNKISNNFNIDLNSVKMEFVSKIEDYGMSLASSLPDVIVNVVKAFFSGIGIFLIGSIIGFFLLISFDGTDKVMSFLPKKVHMSFAGLFSKIEDSLRKYVQGTLTLSSLVFVVSSIGFAISGIKSPLLFGLFCGITNIIPYVGPYLGAAPAILVGFSQGPTVGIGVLITAVLVQVIEGNILNPIVMSKSMKLHPVTIILGLLIFEHFWGIIGMILATPIIAIFKIVFEYFDDKYDIINKTTNKNVEEE